MTIVEIKKTKGYKVLKQMTIDEVFLDKKKHALRNKDFISALLVKLDKNNDMLENIVLCDIIIENTNNKKIKSLMNKILINISENIK